MRRRQLVPPSICSISRFVFLRFFLRPLSLGLVLLGLAVAWAQDMSTGALRGSGLDAQGAVVTDADIIAICVETGLRYHTATDAAGRFVTRNLLSGLLSTTYEFHEGDECLRSATDAIGHEAEFLGWWQIFYTFRLTSEGKACHN